MDKVDSSKAPPPENPPAQQISGQSSIKPLCCSSYLKPIVCLLIAVFLVVAITVGGYYLWVGIYPVTQPLGPSGSPTPRVTKPTSIFDLTANWKTYVNNKYHYAIKIPGIFELDKTYPYDVDEDSLDIVTFYGDLGEGNLEWSHRRLHTLSKIYISDYINGDTQIPCLTDDECYSKVEKDIQHDYEQVSVISATILGRTIRGMKVSTSVSPPGNIIGFIYPFTLNGQYFKIAIFLENYTDDQLATFVQLQNQILPTFRLLDQITQEKSSPADQIESWKVYKDEEITFRYPSEWNRTGPREGARWPDGADFVTSHGEKMLNFYPVDNYNPDTGKPFSYLEEVFEMRSFNRMKEIQKWGDDQKTSREVVVDNQRALWVKDRNPGHDLNEIVSFLSPDKKSLMTFYFSYQQEKDDLENKVHPLFNQILSTFKFLDEKTVCPTGYTYVQGGRPGDSAPITAH